MEGQLPTASDIDELLAFLPRLYAPGFKPVDQWKGGEKLPDGSTHVPWPEYNAAVREFFEKAEQPAWADYDYLAKVEDSMIEAHRHDQDGIAKRDKGDAHVLRAGRTV